MAARSYRSFLGLRFPQADTLIIVARGAVDGLQLQAPFTPSHRRRKLFENPFPLFGWNHVLLSTLMRATAVSLPAVS